MPQIEDKVADEDVTCMLALRAAIVRRAPRPVVPMESAVRLQRLGYARPTGAGSAELTEAGLVFLEQYFLFCKAVGCDGVLRRWTYLSPQHSGSHPEDPDVERNRAGGWYIKCPKCASLNLLEDDEYPVRLGDFKVKSVIPAV